MRDGRSGSGGGQGGASCGPSFEGVQKRQTSLSRCDKYGSLEPPIFVQGHYKCQNNRCITDGNCCQGAPLLKGRHFSIQLIPLYPFSLVVIPAERFR